jgi:hypothetical protein
MLEANKSKLADSAAPIPSVTFLREEYFNEDEAARALDRAPITLDYLLFKICSRRVEFYYRF